MLCELSVAPTRIFGSTPPVVASVTSPEIVYGSGFAIVIDALPATPRYVAVTTTSPGVNAVTRPATAVAIAVFDELHDEVLVTFTVELSDMTAVAVNGVEPGIAGVVPVTVTDATVGVLGPGAAVDEEEDPQARVAARQAGPSGPPRHARDGVTCQR